MKRTQNSQTILKKNQVTRLTLLISKTEYKATVLWPPDSKSWLNGKDPDAREDWGQQEKGVTEDEKLNGITDSMDMTMSKLREKVLDR